MPLQQDTAWHLDKKVPLALIFSLAAQTAAVLLWIGLTTARINQLEEASRANAPNIERIVRLETKVDNVFEMAREIKAMVAKR